MGSLRWLSLGATLVLSACSDAAMSRPGDAGAAEDSPGVDVLLPDHLDGSIVDATAVACSSRSGYFACGSSLCSRAIQTCEALVGDAPGSCEWYGKSAISTCGACPTCECLNAHRVLASCKDDGAGGITLSVRPPGVTGDPCKSDADCQLRVCRNGVCDCEPAGGTQDCCSGWLFYGACTAQMGSACTATMTDCYGGPCEGGACSCVGPGGSCFADRDCCAGATRCVTSSLSTQLSRCK